MSGERTPRTTTTPRLPKMSARQGPGSSSPQPEQGRGSTVIDIEVTHAAGGARLRSRLLGHQNLPQPRQRVGHLTCQADQLVQSHGGSVRTIDGPVHSDGRIDW